MIQDGLRRGMALGTRAVGEKRMAEVSRGKSMLTLVGLEKILEAEVQSETIMEQKWGPWPHSLTFVVNILFFLFGVWHGTLLETGDRKGLGSPHQMGSFWLWQAHPTTLADPSRPTWARLLTVPLTHPKIYWPMPLPLWNFSYQEALMPLQAEHLRWKPVNVILKHSKKFPAI